MKIVIVGAGAIGRLFGALLSRGGHKATLVEPNQEIVESINRQGIGIMDIGQQDPDAASFVPAQAVSDPSTLSECDLVLLAVKSFDTLTAVKSVVHLIDKDSPVISIQTGLGNLEVMEKVVPRQAIIGGFTFMAATSLGAAKIRHGGIGKTYLGELDGIITPRLTEISNQLNQCGIQTSPVQRIIGRLWCKIIVYSAINPVSAILRVNNGSLLDRMESITLMKRLVDEGKEVAKAYSIDLVYPDLYELLFDACRKTSDNLSSMLQDMLNEKRTELDAQNGALCCYGEKKNIFLPTHRTIVELVKLMGKYREPAGTSIV